MDYSLALRPKNRLNCFIYQTISLCNEGLLVNVAFCLSYLNVLSFILALHSSAFIGLCYLWDHPDYCGFPRSKWCGLALSGVFDVMKVVDIGRVQHLVYVLPVSFNKSNKIDLFIWIWSI